MARDVGTRAGSRAAHGVGAGPETEAGPGLRMISQSSREDHFAIVRTRAFWSAPARSAIVSQARDAVAGFATDGGLSGVRLDDVRTCVSEAVTNAVLHAFRDGRTDGTITVSAELRRGALTVIVADDGIGFRPRSDSPGLGMGLPMMLTLADSMTVAPRARGGTEVAIAFNLADPT